MPVSSTKVKRRNTNLNDEIVSHIASLRVVVVSNVRLLTACVFGLFSCVFVWKMTKTLAMNGRWWLRTSRVFG